MFTVDQVISEHYPSIHKNRLFNPVIKPVLQRLFHEAAFLEFADRYPHFQGIEFIEQVMEYFHFSYTVSDRQRENIPSSGRVVIIANHPIGSLDGMSLIKLVHSVRSDVKIVANDLLMAVQPLKRFFLPVNNMGGRNTKEYIRNLHHALKQEQAVIIFPAGEVSRVKPGGIKDGPWQQGFLKIAERAKAPLLPVHIGGRNSAPFYFTSTFIKPLSTFMLVSEMFKQQSKQIKITIGGIIPYEVYAGVAIRRKEKTRLLKKHLYRIGAGKKQLFETVAAIARPERKTDLKRQFKELEPLGRTPDGKTIYLIAGAESSPVFREIGRLREITFRAVGEGSGRRRDIDRFDPYYNHLVLWDEDDLEIAGAYRFVDSAKVIGEKGLAGLYSGSLFEFDEHKSRFLHQGLELGRSFVQQRYWGKRSLDYLWYGIGAYLAKNPQYRYLFGPLSISNSMPLMAKELLIYFYKLYFSDRSHQALSINPFTFSIPTHQFAGEFTGDDYREDFKRLKSLLKNLSTAVPPLYKQYADLCDKGGVSFIDFNVDPDFNNCVDGLVIVDIEKLKPKKRKRYIEETILKQKSHISS